MFRREWRQQAAVVGLLTFTVAAALVMIAATYNAPSSPESRYGTAAQLTRISADPATLSRFAAQARAWFGTVDVIGARTAPIPGLTRSVEIRAQDPHGPYGGPMLRLVSGRYPTAAGEVALTDEVADLMDVRVGASLNLDGRTRTVVGMVENPGNLDAEFVLVPPAFADPPTALTILTAASRPRFDGFAWDGPLEVSLRERNERTVAAVSVFGLVTLAMLLVGLVAVAAFVALAQRRRRQFGLLAATGATERHVRLVLLAGGAAAGTVAAGLGAAIAAPLWIAAVPRLEAAAGHRIARSDLPWWLVFACLLLAVVTAVGAAWWPAWAAARIPVTQALSMRPPRLRPAHRSAVVALLLLAAGFASFRLAHQNNVLLNVAGTVAVAIGLPLLGPLAVRVAAAVGAHLPVAPRLALRDLARHRARSGAALGAISLALAVPAIVVIESAASVPPGAGNLPERLLLIRVGAGDTGTIPDWTPEQVTAVERAVRGFAATLGTPTVIGLDAAMDPKARQQSGVDGGAAGRMPIITGVIIRDSANRVTGIHSQDGGGALYLAHPDLLRYLGIDPGAMGPDTEVLTSLPAEPLVFLPEAERLLRNWEPTWVVTAPMPRPAYSSLPVQLLNPATVARRGWTVVRAGWLIEAERPLTTAQVAAARAMAVEHGLSVEARDTEASLRQLRATATGTGGVLALGVLAMTVGLIRGEAGRDLRTLTATGATRRIRRTLAATTAGALALLGAILGVAAAYLTLVAIHQKDIGRLGHVPVVELAVTVLGVPLVATASAWLLAGREPRSLVRDI
jgi:putative ABC transport system permease protein